MANYEEKYEDKTVRGNYTELEIVYDDNDNGGDLDQKMMDGLKNCKLNPKVSELIRLIFDVKIIQNTLTEIGYDVNKMPLGKLS